jgi:hypothetical protein
MNLTKDQNLKDFNLHIHVVRTHGDGETTMSNNIAHGEILIVRTLKT